MDCPVCNKPLIIVERNKIELDYCIICKGIWFDEGELQLVPEALNLDFRLSDILKMSKVNSKEKLHNCPRCKTKMEKVCFENKTPIVDHCINGHGIWFDAGELGQFFNQYNNKNVDNIDSDESSVINFLGEVFSSSIKKSG
ncbi:MAG: zf-TFIIB domain-containing protein [bacterium]